MKVDLYERIWMWGTAGMLALFFGSTAFAAIGRQFQPPSHVETINPARAMSDPRFARRGVWQDDQGGVHVTVIGMMFAWLPDHVTVPAETPVTFHLTSPDVTHGYQIVRTNGQTMVIPGYVSRFTTRFARADPQKATADALKVAGKVFAAHVGNAERDNVVRADHSLCGRPGPQRLPFRVHDRRRTAIDDDLRGRAVSFSDGCGDGGHFIVEQRPHRRQHRADGSGEHNLLGDDVRR